MRDVHATKRDAVESCRWWKSEAWVCEWRVVEYVPKDGGRDG